MYSTVSSSLRIPQSDIFVPSLIVPIQYYPSSTQVEGANERNGEAGFVSCHYVSVCFVLKSFQCCTVHSLEMMLLKSKAVVSNTAGD